MKAQRLGIKAILADGTIVWFRPRNRRYRFVCGTCKHKGPWTSYSKAERDMRRHGPAKKPGQGHGGSVIHRETSLVMPIETKARLYDLFFLARF